ncbi:MAG: amidohydrolase [Clostridiales bacterium]|nr:amidohydrolase [Clostridiales bacterium]
MKILDAHVHIYPDAIADKASQAISDFYGYHMDYNGSVAQLLKEGKEAGITHYLVHSVATTHHQVASINSFLHAEVQKHPEFIGFCTLHPSMTEEEIASELDKVIQNGFKGIKLHPDFQRFYVDGEDAMKIYRVNNGRLPILLHMGDKRTEFSQPERLVKMAKLFPNTTFIGAHFGSHSCNEKIPLYKGLDNVMFDTSSSFAFMPDLKVAKDAINLLGYEKFMFATDYPMWDAKSELEYFFSLGLSDEENEAILFGNAARLLGIN